MNTHPLIKSMSPHCEIPILTVEMYPKGYSLWVLYPDGHVEMEPFPYHLDMPAGQPAVGDHCVHPLAAQKLAKEKGWVVDCVAFEVMIGRWELDYKARSEYSSYED